MATENEKQNSELQELNKEGKEIEKLKRKQENWQATHKIKRSKSEIVFLEK